MFKKILLVFLVILALPLSALQAQSGDEFTLTLMHTANNRGYHTPDDDNIGGVARQATIVKQIRAENPNSLLLDVGGRFTGSLFHRVWQGQDNVQVMNALGYDAMSLGNSDFDNGDEGLARFIDGLTFPVVSSNIDVSGSEFLAGKIEPYTIVDVGGQPIGVIGLTTEETPRISSPSDQVIFSEDYVGSIMSAVEALTGSGVNKIILLSFIDFSENTALAAELSGVDVMIGGRGEAFLSNLYADATAEYPLELTGADGEPIVFVQAGEFNRFLGRVDVTFDEEGKLTDWGGEPIILFQYIPDDPEFIPLIEDLERPVQDYLQSPILDAEGKPANLGIALRLDGCRETECLLGNALSDAIRQEMGTQIAIMNGGSLREELTAGQVTYGQLLGVLPFQNVAVSFEVSGADLVLALENSVSNIGEESGTGRFLQVSGMRYTYDISQPEGARIVSIETLTDSGEYEPLDVEATYSVATNNFILNGGDGYTMLAENAQNVNLLGRLLDLILADYLAAQSPFMPELEGRIQVMGN